MFTPPRKYSDYVRDIPKSIDWILSMLRKPKVEKIIPGHLINVSPLSGTGEVTVSVDVESLHSGGLYSQTASGIPVTTSGSLIDGGVGTLSVPANAFKVGDAFVGYFSGKISSANNKQLQIQVMSGPSILADTGVFTLPATTNKNWEMRIDFVIRSIGAAGVASIVTAGRFSFNKDSNNQPESIGFSSINNTSFDTTVTNTLSVNATWVLLDPLNSIISEQFNLYRIY